ncbi:Serpin domain containing protein [Asbolus verrucosus]|uniref:Serpin domain containing protein n=1 Tax=Asbolus verrucosus TaxID=1661398 RepID=A0A482W157_ASBVE|nr:Serpin domain containing protein [Asbolus verrucosus]
MSYTKMKCLTFLLFGLTSALATDRVLQEFINANNIFTAPVYKQVLSLNKDKPNFLISPFSAETVLALTLSGCKGETADEIRNALHLTDDQKNGGDISMTIILPNEKNGVASLENQIDRVFVPHNLTAEVVNVALPKFKIETKIDFKKVLPHLGVEAAFDANKADLSGIAGKKGDLYISEVIQKTFIDVAESGVEAAAATYVASRGYSAIPIEDPPVPKEFIADHPFIFYIKAKGFIIFAGKVSAPDQ